MSLSYMSSKFTGALRHWRQRPLVPIALVLIVLSLIAFVEISEDIHEHEDHEFDRAVLLAMRDPTDPAKPLGSLKIQEMGRDLTALGGFTILSGLTFASIGIAFFLKKPRIAAIIAVAITGGMFLTSGLKKGFDRPRPDLVPHGVVVSNASFPSGHSMMSAIVYLTLGTLLARTQPSLKFRIYLISLSVIVTVLVGVSRVYLGVHWPTDVMAGWAFGAAWALLFWLIANYVDPRSEHATKS